MWALSVIAGAPSSALASASASAPAADASEEAEAITPPAVIRKVDAVYPAGAVIEADVIVELLVTVGEDGRVRAIEVDRSGGADFDAAAIAAVGAWELAPARRGDTPIAAKIRVPFTFTPPAVAAGEDAGAGEGGGDVAAGEGAAPPASDAEGSTPPEPGAGAEAEDEDEAVLEVEVRGRRPQPPRSASDLQIDGEVLRAAPRRDAGDLMSSAPGVYISRPEGEAVAHEIILRGFDAAHGQDIELTVGALPLNQISHIHGQGYADLGIVIPEVVRSMRVREGVYDPRQGDFAVAGSVDFDLGVTQRGLTLRSAGGSFATFRQLVLWAPKGQDEGTFAAATVRRTSGFGVGRGGISGAAIGQLVLRARDRTRVTLHAAAYGARAGLAGVLRRDDVDAGIVGFYDAYDDPSARSQSASATRGQVMVDVDRRGEADDRSRLAIWTAYSDFRSRENFTGYLQRSMVMPEWVGRGDLIEQSNADIGAGFLASHRTKSWRPAKWFAAALELGTQARLHRIGQAQNLLQAPQNETWDNRVDATIRASDIGVYGDLELRLGRRVTLRGGGRADVLHYDIDDRLGNFIAPYQVASHIVGYRRAALGVAGGPRASLEFRPLEWLRTFAAYGQGYRSPQARQLEEGENAPFTKVHSVEGGLRITPAWRREALTISAAGFGTFLDNDLAFDPEEGRLEKIGPSQRSGLSAHVLLRPLPWLVAAASVTYVRAVLSAPPPATAENPSPAFVAGQRLPYVPPVVVRGDVGVDRQVTTLAGQPLALRAGAGYSYLAPRPLPYGAFAAPVHQLDLSAGVAWSYVELGVDVHNALNRKIAATEYAFVSDWGTRPIPSRLPARHFAAAPPLAAMGTLTLHF
ncbi:MAG: TonB-dependent receptor [Myxococcales bacterium]|nr:TonB-dependent receptor [Myxococcales bacterium]